MAYGMLGMPLASANLGAMDLAALKRKQGWKASLFDRLGADGEGMDEGSKKGAINQGLLALAVAMSKPNGGNFANSLATGLSGGLLAANGAQDDKLKRQKLRMGGDDPQEFRARHMTAVAAGYTPGSPEYQNFMRVAGGIEGRAATGGFGFTPVKGKDGRTRMSRTNPRTGVFEVYNDETGDFEPQGGGAGLNTSQPMGGPPVGTQPVAGEVPFSVDPTLPQHVQDAIRANEPAWASGQEMPLPPVNSKSWTNNTPNPYGNATPGPAAPAPAPAPPRPRLSTRPPGTGLGTSRTPEEEAAAVAQAKANVALDNAPKFADIDVDKANRIAQGGQAALTGGTAARAGDVRTQALRDSLPMLRASQRSLLDAYRGLESGKYTSGALTGLLPDRLQSSDNQVLLTTINEEVLATAEKMKGTLSDKDVAFLNSATFSVSKDEQANMIIIGKKLRILNDAIKRAEALGADDDMRRPAPGAAVRKKFNPATGRIE